MRTSKIKSIKPIGSRDKYDLEVKDNHNFFANGVLVHNCRVAITSAGAFSRNGKPFVAFPHIKELLNPIFEKYPNYIIDGEIYTHSYKDNFNKIISLAKKSKPTQEDLEESKNSLEYWVFDVGGTKLKFRDRLKIIAEIVSEVNSPSIKLVSHEVVRSDEEIEEKFAAYLEEGFEGAMLKNLEAVYQNKRTKDVLKYKLFQTEEFKIVDISEGIGNRSGKFGRATLETKEGRLFDANARGDEEFYKDLFLNREEYIGQMATVRFQNWTPGEKSCPRFPVITSLRNYE